MSEQSKLAVAAWLSLAGVLYLTLLPFNFQFVELSLAQAIETYRSLTFGQPQPGARQQWVANAIMFVPFGFFWTGWLTCRARGEGVRLLAGLAVAGLALLVTASVEFLQSWIPGRSPSLQDMSGNFVGGVVGVLVWLLWSGWLRRGLAVLGSGGGAALRWGLCLYLLFYIVASLLPLDFLLSRDEVLNKLVSGHWGFWTAPSGCEASVRCGMLRVAEALLTVPVGIWFAVVMSERSMGNLRLRQAGAFGFAVLFGIALEMGQFFTVSGIAEGMAALARALGVVIGVWTVKVWKRTKRTGGFVMPVWMRRVLLVACLPYLVLMVVLNLGAKGFQLAPHAAAAQLADLRFLPFYYHYYVAEATAIFSVLAHLWMYAPVGWFVWLWRYEGRRNNRPVGAGPAVVLAVLLAVFIESGKLFMAGLRPDPSSVLIAAFAGWAGLRLLDWLVRSLGGGAAVARTVEPEKPRALLKDRLERLGQVAATGSVASSTGSESVSRTAQGLGVLLLAVTLGWAVTWPVAVPWLVVALAIYAIWLWRQPAAWLLVIPALAPTLNLALYTGRFFFDELDLFLLATVAVIALRWRVGRGIIPLPRTVAWALAVFALSVAISLGIGLFPLPPADANALVNYTNNYNALRDAKGFFWALLLFVLLQQSRLPAECLMQRWFVPGMALGLMGTAAVVLWERATYPGLLNFSSSYRISGLFTDMHVGGPSIETYLVMATPFALLWAWQRRHWAWQIPALGLLVVVLYGVVVTYSRGGYLGMAVALGVILVGALAGAVALRGPRRWRLAALAVLPLVVAGLVLPRVTGSFFEGRMAQLESDFGLRMAHWRLVMDLRGPGLREAVFGSGLGRFPQAYAWDNPEGRSPANFGYAKRAEGTVLRLGTGDSLFINQRLNLPHRGDYIVEITAQADRPSRLALFVCEKHVRHSFTCLDHRVHIPEVGSGTGPLLWRFDADGLATGPWFARRQLTFSFANFTNGGIIDIERLSLKSSDGRELLRNGDFSQGGRYWYFSTDHLWPWRTENQWLDVLFAQGWLGLLSFIALTLFGMLALLRSAARGVFDDACLLAALAGTLAVGVFSTVFWSPRLSLLFYLILLLGVAVSYARHRQQQ